MKPAIVVSAVAVLLAAGAASARLLAAPATSSGPPAARAGDQVLWGHIRSLRAKGSRFELRFDPAWWLTGHAAERAAFEDTGSSDVPNDYYIVDEGHRLLTYLVPATARVSVLTRGLRPATISVAELAQIVKGRNPRNRPLFDRQNALGYWIRVGSKYPSLVLSLEQQYQP
jgi:hypothetical protein